MKRILFPVLLFLFVFIGRGVQAGDKPVPMYQIEIKLIETMPDGRELVLNHPQLMTLEGQPASIDIRPTILPPKGIKPDEPLRSGMCVLVNVLRKDGQVFLDATVDKSQTGRADAEGVHITTQSVRVVELITLGKKIIVPSPWAKTLRWELLVQAPQPKPSSGNKATMPMQVP